MLAMGAVADKSIVDSPSKIQLLLETGFGNAVQAARVCVHQFKLHFS